MQRLNYSISITKDISSGLNPLSLFKQFRIQKKISKLIKNERILD